MPDNTTTAQRTTLRTLAAETRLGTAGKRVVAYIDRNPVEALASSAAEIAARASTSDATVIRTVQLLGFEGLAGLKQALVRWNSAATTPAEAMRRTLTEMAPSTFAATKAVLRVHEEGLAILRSKDTQARIAEAALVLDHASRVVVFGIGPSAALADYVATLLRRAGRRSRTLDRTGGMLADQLLDLAEGDALLLLAYGSLYREVRVVIATARELGLPIVLFTEHAQSRLARMADKVVAVPRGKPGHVALHGATMVALEAMLLALSATDTHKSVQSLERLTSLRRTLGHTASPEPGSEAEPTPRPSSHSLSQKVADRRSR